MRSMIHTLYLEIILLTGKGNFEISNKQKSRIPKCVVLYKITRYNGDVMDSGNPMKHLKVTEQP